MKNLGDKLIIRRQKEMMRVCLNETKEHPVLTEDLMKIQKQYDKLLNGVKMKDEKFKYLGLLGMGKKEQTHAKNL